MLIVCPACTAAYRIELSTLGAAGRTVRCARCRATWFASVADLASAALALPSGQGTDPPAPAPDERREGEQEHEAGGTADAAADPTSITIDNAPSLVPALAHETGAAGASGADIETLAARRERQGAGKSKRRRRARPGLPTIILALAAVLAALVNWRAAVVRFVPQTAGLFTSIGLPVNLRGLSLDDVKTSMETHEGVAVLVVEGTIANLTRQPLELPRLRFAVRNAAGYEVYAWTALPGQPTLAPGDRAPFRSRLASPPADAQDIIVRFFTRRDVAAAAN
jgi:predicted Zn finger-like uncharacterized protein